MTAPRSAGRVLGRSAVAVAVSAGLVGLLLSRVDAGRLFGRAADVRIGPFALAFVCSVVVLLLRAQRFHALAERARYRETVAAVAVQNFLVRVTPFRLGELGLPVFLHRVSGEPLVRSLVSVVLVRLVELWMLLMLGACATAAWLGPRASERGLPLVTYGALVLVTAAVVGFRFFLDTAAHLVTRLTRGAGGRDAPGLGGKLARAVQRLREVLADGARLSLGARLRLGAGTALIAVFQYTLFWSLLAMFDVRLGPLPVLVGGTAAQLAAALPVPSVGSVGPLEAAWVAGFSWVGVGFDDAVLTAVACQVVTLAFAGLFAAGAWFSVGMGRAPRDIARAPENNARGGDV